MKELFDNVVLCENLETLQKNEVLNLVNSGKYVIFPHEWEKRRQQIKSHFSSYTTKLVSTGARQCTIREVNLTVLRDFCDQYHIQGSNKLAFKAWGIFNEDDDILGVLSLGRHHRENGITLLDRLCFNPNCRVVGGASKLLSVAKKWATENGIKEIVSFSDRRWSTGQVYEKMGFVKDKVLKPDYFYVKTDDYFQYFSKQSQKKENTGCPDETTESEWANQNGLLRVYDAGKIRWILPLTRHRTIKNPLKKRRIAYHKSPKAGIIYCDSSYELKAAIMLDEDETVLTYSNQVPFMIEGRKRFTDFLIIRKSGLTIREVKPVRRLKDFKEQIDDNRWYATQNNWEFEVWTEQELGFKSEYFATKWADEYLSKIGDVDYVEIRKKRNVERSQRHYKKTIGNKKITFYCNYCHKEHEILKICYDRNIKKNGRFICIVENGHLVGKNPKKKKENPYAPDGKKQCNQCKEIKPFEEFGIDKIKSDGYSTRCKKCRSEAELKRYYNDKN